VNPFRRCAATGFSRGHRWHIKAYSIM
jgi:hypothetical protein